MNSAGSGTGVIGGLLLTRWRTFGFWCGWVIVRLTLKEHSDSYSHVIYPSNVRGKPLLTRRMTWI